MASGINNIQHSGTCNGSKASRSSSAEECNREMHMKMCKKIAQLTKVIYALNTKNDEHEASIQALREAHEEEIQHILAETRETILQCESKVEEEQLLRKHIQALEIAVEQHKRLKEEALAELTLCKKQVEEKELRTEVKQAQPVLSTDMVDTSEGFENNLPHLNQQFDGLLNECKASRRENPDKNCSIEGHALINEMENVKSKKQNATKEYPQKTSKLQAPYEREKETLKKAMEPSMIETKMNCQQREPEQRKSSETEEGFLLQQVKKLEADLEEKSQKINERKKHSQKLKERIQVDSQCWKIPRCLSSFNGTLTHVHNLKYLSCCKGSKETMDILEDTGAVFNCCSNQNLEENNVQGRLYLLRSSCNTDLCLNIENSYSEKQCRNNTRSKLKRKVSWQSCSGNDASDLQVLIKKTVQAASPFCAGKTKANFSLAELQTQLDEFKRKSECELKQLEKEKEVLTGKLQNSSLEKLKEYLNKGCDPSGNGKGPQKKRRKHTIWRREASMLIKCEKEQGHELAGVHLAIIIIRFINEIIRMQATSFHSSIKAEKYKYKKFKNRPSSFTCSPKQKARDIKVLQEAKNQQANNFKESLKKHNLQSNKEKEKLLQDLQNTIKENQNVKLQLEASHQKVLKMLEKSKNQELKEAEERLKKEFSETFKIQHQSHRLEIQTLEEKAKKELHDELEQIQKQQALLLGTLRMELSEQQTSCTNLKKQIEELQMELRSVRTLKKQQARNQFLLHCHVVFSESRSSQSQIRSLHDELEKCQSEISELKKENLLLKDTMELLSAELESQKQEATQLQDRDKQHRRLLVEDLNIKHKKELDTLKQDHRKEIENILSDFSSTRAHLQAKIFSLETALEELEEKSRKWESRSEDAHLINCLQDKLSEREEIIKQLVEGSKCQHSLSAHIDSSRNRSFSFNPNIAGLTPSIKKKKTVEVPSRVVSVPNLASYAKSFLSCDLRSKRSAPQITKSTSLDRSPGCLSVGSPSVQSSESNPATRTHDSEPPQTKDDPKQDPQNQEWFTKYFSF
ncbi:F184B protein, partial [Campylorhamphus procurvoides]|nr:F184B protein [Campylorhamphus procurvoides]